jgi:ABC-2 type transport system ATP-binding protein
MITVEELSKRYGGTLAVDAVTFTAAAGRVTGFLGPNGAGKSTTMRIIVGLTRATSGTATIAGRKFADLPNPGREVGVLLDASAQHAGRTGREILTLAQRLMGLPRGRVEEMLTTVSLTPDEASRRVGEYSLGMRQRLGIATALIGDPDVLILDEPANGLDPQGIRWLRDFLTELTDDGRTVLLSSHQLAEVAQTADEVIVLGRGQIVTQGALSDFLGRFARRHVLVRSPEAERLAHGLELNGIGPVSPEGPDGLVIAGDVTTDEIGDLAAQYGITLHELTARSSSLEEAFLEATEGSTDFEVTT